MTPDTTGGRSCANCACSFVIEPPRLATVDNPNMDTNLPPVRICRRDRPVLMEKKIRVMQNVPGKREPVPVEQTIQHLGQQQVLDGHVCWDWIAPGTLPGDQRTLPDKYLQLIDILTETLTGVLDQKTKN
jgi:hypothetical protein